uniref:ANF_receptor domain-containing protein n=2 Tax=Thalassocalyce inconstans TaxID=140487 RepID=V9PPW5_THAIN|nr:ANF_receptor domain-containing protein [Thalassocalyce inconstans]
MLLKLLTLLLALQQNSAATKVGLLLSKSDIYNYALKNLANYAAENVSYTLVTSEYDSTLKSMIDASCDLVDNGVSIIISKGTSTNTAVQSDIFSPLKIPHIAISATDPYLYNDNRKYLIRLSSSDRYQSKAIYDLIKQYNWYEVSLFASADSYGLNGVIELEHLLIKDHTITIVNTLFFEAKHENLDVTSQLTDIKNSLSKVIILNSGGAYGKRVLEQAYGLGLLGKGFVWIVTDAISSQPEYLTTNGAFLSFYEGLIGIRLSRTKSDQYKELKDRYLQKNDTLLSDLTSYTLLTYDAVGLVKAALNSVKETLTVTDIQCTSSMGWDQGETVLSAIQGMQYTGVTGHINFTKTGESTRVAYDIMNFKDDQFQKVGSWYNATGLQITQPLTFLGGSETIPTGVPDDLIGRHLKLGIMEEAPFAYFNSSGECTGNSCWSGVINDMIVRLSEELGFTYEYLTPLDGKGGARIKETGDWNGMVGELIHGRIDVIAFHFSTNSARKAAIDFSFPFMDAAITAVVKGASPIKNTFFFLDPFNKYIWCMILVAYFVVTAIIGCLNQLSPFDKHGAKLHAQRTCSCQRCTARQEEMINQNCISQGTKKFDCLIDEIDGTNPSTEISLYNTIWLVGTGLVAQTPSSLPFCMPVRFLLLSWWVFMLVFISMYTANLTAFLTISNLGIKLKSVADLLHQNDYEWGLIGSRHPETLLLSNMDKVYSRVVKEGKILDNLTIALENVREGDFVFIDESPVLEYNLRVDCDVFSVGSEFQTFEYAFGLPKHSPYKTLIDSHLLKFREDGFIDTIWARWSSVSYACNQGVGETTTLDLDTVSGVFYLLVIAIAISLILFLVELVYASFHDTKLDKDLTLSAALKRRLTFRKGSAAYRRKQDEPMTLLCEIPDQTNNNE